VARASPYDHGRSEIHGRRGLATAIRAERRRLGERIRRLRVERELTQAEAAEAIGIHPVHVARIESGSANITIATLVAVAVAYGVPVRALFGASE
jgi:DNA-binding XRE family transcriptional regulator